MTIRLVLVTALAVSLVGADSRPVSSASTQPPPGHFAKYDAEAKAILARMTLEEKIGQMIQAEQDFLTDEADIEKYYLGSLLAGGNGDPVSNSLQDWTEMYDRYQSRAGTTTSSGQWSSRTTSAWARRVTRLSSRRSPASPPRKCAPPA
jgi:beta-glucosidase